MEGNFLVDVNKILGIEENEEETPDELVIENFVEKDLKALGRCLESFPETIRIAINRKVPFSKVPLGNVFGLKILYNQKELDKKVKWLGYSTVKKTFSELLESYTLVEIANYILEKKQNGEETPFRLDYVDDYWYIGLDSLENTVFFSRDENGIYLYLFNLVAETDFENNILVNPKIATAEEFFSELNFEDFEEN